MGRDTAAWAVCSEAERKLRSAQDAYRASRLKLVEIKKDDALDALKKYPQHAETVLNELVDGILNILR